MTDSRIPAKAESGTIKEQYKIVGIAKPVVRVKKIIYTKAIGGILDLT